MYEFSYIHLHYIHCVSFSGFSAWGESVIKASQTSFLVVLFFYYTNRPLAAILFPFLYGGIVYILVSGLTPMAVLVQLVSLNILFLFIGRVSVFFIFRKSNVTSQGYNRRCEGYHIFTSLPLKRVDNTAIFRGLSRG